MENTASSPESPEFKPEGWEPQFCTVDRWPADTPDTIAIKYEAWELFRSGILDSLRLYVDLLQRAEEIRRKHPVLAAIVEAIEERKVENLSQYIDLKGVSRERIRRVEQEVKREIERLGV